MNDIPANQPDEVATTLLTEAIAALVRKAAQ